MERLCIQTSNSRNFTLRVLDKAAYIFNILLQFIVSPQLSVQCLPSSKRIQKNRFGHYLQEHVISELSKLRVSGGGAALTKADMLMALFVFGLFFSPFFLLKKDLPGSHCVRSDKEVHTRIAESFGLPVTLEIHNLHYKEKK